MSRFETYENIDKKQGRHDIISIHSFWACSRMQAAVQKCDNKSQIMANLFSYETISKITRLAGNWRPSLGSCLRGIRSAY